MAYVYGYVRVINLMAAVVPPGACPPASWTPPCGGVLWFYHLLYVGFLVVPNYQALNQGRPLP